MIRLNSISKAYGENVVLKDFSYSFKQTGIFCIKGVSGCGKTTLLRIISGLEKADSGSVNINGSLAFMFQEDRLFPWLNVEQNIACVLHLGKKENLKIASELLCSVGLSDCAKHNISTLSGGMKRRVALLRALAPCPDILLLDEAFNGIDADTKKKIYEQILEYSKEHLVILVSHDEGDITLLADTVIEL